MRLLISIIGLVIFGVLAAASVDSPSDSQPEKTEAQKAAEEAKCREDLTCFAERHVFSASSRCQAAIEKLAKYDFQWTDSWSEMKFSHYRWKNKVTGIVTYLGDKIKFQNGFGAWRHYSYWCDYDVANKTVVDFGATEGRRYQ